MNEERVIRVGLIGGGGITDSHLRGYARQPGIAVTAICDADASTLARRTESLGVPGYLDYRDMLDAADIDAVDICLPHHLHADAVVAAVRAGKHVLCEKPLATTMADLDRIETAARSTGVTVMCAHNQAYRPVVQMANRMRDDGLLGDVSLVRVTCRIPLPSEPGLGWRASRSRGGGALLDSGFHAAYLLPLLAGAPPVEVACMEGRFRFHDAEAEDTALVLVRFANGVIGQIDVSWAVGQVGESQTIELAGTQGVLTGGDAQARFRLEGSREETHHLPIVDTYEAEIAAFARVVRDGDEPDQGISAARQALSIVTASRESRSSGSMVAVGLSPVPA